MAKIINLYCITYGPHRLESEKMVIERLAEVVENTNKDLFDIQVHICDNNSPLEFKTWLLDTYDKKFKLFLSNENIGKARIVNHVHRNARPCEYVCSMDSDMLIKNDDFFEHMIYGLDHFDGKIGLVCANQDKGNIHMMQHAKDTLSENGHTYKCTTIGGVFAGSCLMIHANRWNRIGGYAEFDNIFGGNDGFITGVVAQQHKKYVAVSMEGICDHIGENPQDYHRWKVHQARNIKNTGKFEGNTGFYEK
jgi:glycosyltransferase involved in cell wall biosynthesis